MPVRLFAAVRQILARLWPCRRPRPIRLARSRPRLDALEERLAPATTIVANATSNLLNVPVQFALTSTGNLLLSRGAGTAVKVATGVQGLFQGSDSSGTQVAYDLVGHVLREYTPNHGWTTIGNADQVAQDTSGNVFFRQASALLHATGVPSSTGFQVIASGGVQALTQFSPSQVVYLENKTLFLLSGSTTPSVLQHSVLGLAQDGPDQILFLDGGHTLNVISPSLGRVVIVASNVQALAQSGFNQAVYLTADGTLLDTTNGGTAVTLATNVQALAEARNLTAYVGRNGAVAELSAAGKLLGVPGTAKVTQLIVDGQDQLYALNTAGTLQRIHGTSARTIAWGVTDHAIDSAGELVVLEGPTVYQYFTGQYTKGGINTGVQFALDGSGNLFAISKSGTLASAATSSSPLEQIATGVTQVALDSAGELVYLQGPYTYNYVSGGLATSGTSVSTNGNPPPQRFALDHEGNLYTLAGGVLTVAATSTDTPQQLATGVLGMAADGGGQVVAVLNVHSYAYYGGLLGSGGSSTTTQYAVDPAGNLYRLVAGGALYASATATSTPQLVASGITRMAMDAADEVVLLRGPTVYEYLTGALAMGGSATATQYALDSHGNLYTFHANTVTLAGFSTATPRTIAAGVAQMLLDNTGQVAFLFGSGQLSYYDPVGQQLVPILTSQAQALVDAHGQLDSRGTNGDVYQITARGALTVDYLTQAIGLSSGSLTKTYTAIGQVWHSLLTVHTQMGQPTSIETDVAGGRAVEFQGGEMTWSAPTGVRVIPEEFRTTYDTQGGPSSFLGMPVSGVYQTHDITGTVDGEVLYFQGGALFMSNTGLLVTVSKHLAQAYQQYQSGNRALGAPVAAQSDPATRTEEVTFTDGVLYWSPATGTRLLADQSTLSALSQPALSLTSGWGNTANAIGSTLDQQFGVQLSATGTLSMNLAERTAYANIDFAGAQFDSSELDTLLNDGTPELPPLPNPLDVLTALGRAGVSNQYAQAQANAYGANGVNAANVYFSSSQWVDWARPETVGELIGATAIGAGNLAFETLKQELSQEMQGIIAWATARFGDEATALQQLGTALAQGRVQVSLVQVPYIYTVFGQQIKEMHWGFTVSIAGLPAAASGPPQLSMIGTASAAASALAGASPGDIDNLLGQFALDVADHALKMNLDPSAFDLGSSIADNLANVDLYQQLYTALGIDPTTLIQAYQGRPLIDLTATLGQQLGGTVDGLLRRINGDLRFHVTQLTFNTSTYELSAQVQLVYAHNWGSARDILNTVGNTLWTLGQNLVQGVDHAADWFKQEDVFLANWWHNAGLPDGTDVAPWVQPAIAAATTVVNDLGSAAEPYLKGLTTVTDEVSSSPVGKTIGAIATGHYSFGLTDEQPYGFIPVN